eukprot:TRINITY_DN17798_c0_g1_i2.p1 TRINITY_DN17798_c0_g1~~TRINITY_DN17798_c0_g1_i2.p1  ORF type:complete len:344 (+),score=84.71 TRINITY_DN17798_c0_g1_i2:354-1385(+)
MCCVMIAVNVSLAKTPADSEAALAKTAPDRKFFHEKPPSWDHFKDLAATATAPSIKRESVDSDQCVFNAPSREQRKSMDNPPPPIRRKSNDYGATIDHAAIIAANHRLSDEWVDHAPPEAGQPMQTDLTRVSHGQKLPGNDMDEVLEADLLRISDHRISDELKEMVLEEGEETLADMLGARGEGTHQKDNCAPCVLDKCSDLMRNSGGSAGDGLMQELLRSSDDLLRSSDLQAADLRLSDLMRSSEGRRTAPVADVLSPTTRSAEAAWRQGDVAHGGMMPVDAEANRSWQAEMQYQPEPHAQDTRVNAGGNEFIVRDLLRVSDEIDEIKHEMKSSGPQAANYW